MCSSVEFISVANLLFLQLFLLGSEPPCCYFVMLKFSMVMKDLANSLFLDVNLDYHGFLSLVE